MSNTQPNEPTDKESIGKAESTRKRVAFWFLLLTVSVLALAISGSSLTVGPYPTSKNLVLVYAVYAISVCCTLHAIFFLLNEFSMHRKGRTLSRRVPRYVEYAYALLLSISLAQVYFLSSQFAEFIATVSGDEQQLAKAAVEAARKHVAQDCPNGNPYFPAAYCEKLQKLATSPDPTKYISGVVMPDKTFLTHAIGKKVVGGGFSGVAEVDVTSPIAKIVDSYRARIEFSAAPSPGGSSKAFAWLLVVLLPLGISLRILKTSLELFVDLR